MKNACGEILLKLNSLSNWAYQAEGKQMNETN
jgi:hypothetical protein